MATSLITPKKANTMQLQSTSISKVRVIVRVRPFLPHEIAAAKNGNPISCASVLDQDCESGEEVVVHLNDQETSRRECYKLDSFLGPHDNNVSLIFYREVSPLIPGIFHGCNATVFAYGATGSGKTYTMQGTDELPGLMPLTMSAVLTMCWSTASTAEMSYYEVYMDRCYDLLEVKAKEIAILDDKDGQIHLKGLSRVPISSMSEFYEVFSHGIQRRKVAHTGLNDVSSRSHGVLVISVSTPCDDGFGAVVTGKLNLIDLAGNEDNRRTCNEGIRLQESAKINQSLFALSNVIYALNNNKPRVPYRESKLTRILQDSLGGTSRALMVACLNPGEYQESVHTVSLAARSRHISNSVPSAQKQDTPNVKVDMEAKLRAWLESKGKTKSAQRMRAFGSPLMSKAPSSLSSLKKPYPCHSSTKAKAITNQGASNAKERVLSVQHRNLFNNRGSVDSGTEIEVSLQSFNFAAENNTNNTEDEFKAGGDGSASETNTILPDDALANDKKMTTMKSANSIGSPPISEKFKALQGSLRKVLSPVNSDDSRKPLEDLSSKGQVCSVPFEPKTPKTPTNMTCANDNFQMVDTPLDKFNVRTSNLKSSLIQEYIDFLNTASIEELLELKGIGQKRAEYILELREASPLKMLSDLEKIGLSSKQVYNVFGRTAKGIFD
ncbi:kinesin-like protein KIN-10B isoform X1 [Vitis vinifera]|uniref:kinesin-like protein KIN-10B isoform X1 n=1 Tax=Vitis vinifera TaxID=29760 RepID=UPI00053FA7CB|nr:kinesin-like protein KIN-10B isoform X1 [Vitis vinifera]|eukprot:XP_010654285.1 PREDICTED: kinesin-like protein KIN-10B isoform X1 [Vitis vinifera]